ncbi:hypothetical protein ACFW91_25900 [Streptomyces asoensis]|uniref:hypothetical protein n=1 Tax=Streptomyces asoensis TaxID=249586 RepID=UPI003696DE75
MTHRTTSTDDSSPTATGAPAGFGMPQALVILGFLAAAVILHLVTRAEVHDTALLLAAAGGVSVAVLALLTGFRRGGGGRGLLRRLLKAALTSGASN